MVLNTYDNRYNALVFTSLSANEYRAAVVTEDFPSGAPWNLTDLGSLHKNQADDDIWHKIQQSVSTYKTLSNSDCIKTYTEAFQFSQRNVLLISSEKNDTNSILWFGHFPYNLWVCPNAEGAQRPCNPANWTVLGFPIKYCLVEQAEEVCSVQFSFDIMIILIICNIVKLICMLYILFSFGAENILASVGDAISSFIMVEDPSTSGICLADKAHLYTYWNQPNCARRYDPRTGRWYRAASKKRWIFFTIL